MTRLRFINYSNRMKKILWILCSAAFVALMYYLVIRPYEFEVHFEAKTLPGDLIETIRIWNRSLDNGNIAAVDSFSRLKQSIVWKGKHYAYDWRFTSLNDSVTKVNIRISEPGRSLLNKILIPFTDQHIERDASEIAHLFYKIVQMHLKLTRVKIKGEAETDSSFCVCRALETSQIEKANGMMKDYLVLTSFIDDFNLKVNGKPIVKVNEWNHNLGLLKFDFCFPIVRTTSLPVVKDVTYKAFAKERTLNASYYGNYITSDRAWYELIQYAEKNGYKITGLPIEYFHDNPNMGSNESDWKAEIYIPIE
jgi:hypothetical protein